MVEETNRARLYPKRDGYSVIHDGKLLVSKSRNPECDAARALLAGGITGKLHLFDAGSFQEAGALGHPLHLYAPASDASDHHQH